MSTVFVTYKKVELAIFWMEIWRLKRWLVRSVAESVGEVSISIPEGPARGPGVHLEELTWGTKWSSVQSRTPQGRPQHPTVEVESELPLSFANYMGHYVAIKRLSGCKCVLIQYISMPRSSSSTLHLQMHNSKGVTKRAWCELLKTRGARFSSTYTKMCVHTHNAYGYIWRESSRSYAAKC